ncbi:MAG: DUF502 domain-containing protein [Opitutales bacterium]
MVRFLRNAFISGTVTILPLAVTVFTIAFLIDRVGRPASGIFFGSILNEIPDRDIARVVFQFISLAIVVLLITLIGVLTRFLIGRMVVGWGERFFDRLPFINGIYRTVKQIVDTFSKQEKAVFQKSVLIEYPRKGVYVLGFLTNEAKGEPQAVTDDDLVNIFVPTTPNPTSGFLLMVPKAEVIDLEMSITEGMKLIISGGAVVPPYPAKSLADTDPPAVAGS